jgi:hypothetical protein
MMKAVSRVIYKWMKLSFLHVTRKEITASTSGKSILLFRLSERVFSWMNNSISWMPQLILGQHSLVRNRVFLFQKNY